MGDTFNIEKSDILKLSEINSDVCLELQRLFPDAFGIKTKWVLINTRGVSEYKTLIKLRDYISMSSNIHSVISSSSEMCGAKSFSSNYGWTIITEEQAQEFINNLK